jgi:hypothetical protein
VTKANNGLAKTGAQLTAKMGKGSFFHTPLRVDKHGNAHGMDTQKTRKEPAQQRGLLESGRLLVAKHVPGAGIVLGQV